MVSVNILLEVPKDLLQSLTVFHGANKISQQLLQYLLGVKAHKLVIITNMQLEQSDIDSQQKRYQAACVFTDYSRLTETLKNQDFVPDVGLTFGVNIQQMAAFRNLKGYQFPVMGLIHSLGFENHFSDLLCTRPFLRSHDVFICPSKNTQQTVIAAGIDKQHTMVMPYGIDSSIFVEIDSKLQLKQDLGFSQDSQIIMVLSRISPSVKMDLAPVLRMLPQLIEINPKLILYIVGNVLDHAYVNELKQLVQHLGVENYVKWNHDPNNDAIEQYYQVADIFLTLSDYCGETFGLTVIEAMACSLPVVISNFAGYKDHLTDGKDGFYIPTLSLKTECIADDQFYDPDYFGLQYSQHVALDNDVLILRLSQLLSDEGLRLRLGHNARKKVDNFFTLDHMHIRYQQLINTVVEQSRLKPCRVQRQRLVEISSFLDHQVTQLLSLDQLLSLTDESKIMIKDKKELFFFEFQWKEYKLIRVILHLLSQQDYSFNQLYTMLTVSPSEINKNCLFLLKQAVIKII